MNVAVAVESNKTASITVAFIKKSDDERRSGKVKDTDGVWFGAWNKTLGQMQQGQTYNIEFSETPKDGVIYRNIKGTPVLVSNFESPAVAQKVAAVVRQAQPQGSQHETPRAYNNNPGAAVMGMVNQYINRGDVPLNEDSIAQAIEICAAGYAKSKLGKAA